MSNYGAPDLRLNRFRPGMHLVVDLANVQFSALKDGPDSTHQSLVILKSDLHEELEVNLAWGAMSANLQAARYMASIELECRLDDPCSTCMPTIVTGGDMLSPSSSGPLRMPEITSATRIQGTQWRMTNLETSMPFSEGRVSFPRAAMGVHLSFIYMMSNAEYVQMRSQAA